MSKSNLENHLEHVSLNFPGLQRARALKLIVTTKPPPARNTGQTPVTRSLSIDYNTTIKNRPSLTLQHPLWLPKHVFTFKEFYPPTVKSVDFTW
ncbi:hypothetical protein AVEN_162139-1 [Araneus ventricosus]|uniref:Uncharacterized protein n=1 Tax=Araneus ventricosus TaxID=182803 RepID=A0A4Y2J8D1_ARAVE|nr:hypothetical protein AVEN_162139-1 [Araneus ventricosus]